MAADSPDRESAEPRDEHPEAAAESRKSESTEHPAGSADAAPTAAAPDSDVEDSDAENPAAADDSDAEAPPAAADNSDADDPAAAADEPDNPPESATAHQYSPAIIATAVALPVVLVVAVLVAAVLARRAPVEREPLVLGPVPAPAAEGPACAALLPALPADLGEFTKSTLVEPAPPATRAWQRTEGGDAIVLRCGLDRPLEFNRASPLQVVNGVQWFEVRDQTAEVSTWFAVDRATYVALTVPDGSGPTPLQEVSDTITAHLPAQPIDPGPLPN
ncbi:DUF3515 domain-containing protein [Nocardia abscessus]|uniref:DUF3515 domain-containing protein n=1 Tax=Nocardia abscessus TaxID=120957 RepID=UPI0002EC9228|nr:DUF3515 domain-containing protein [Nocardia abscessus]MCC3329730.1 DUF3515 domain-containing protein [Nocardia abscessus]